MRINYLMTKLMLVAGIGFIFACSSSANNDDQSKELLQAYLGVKDALVKTDANAAGTAAQKLEELAAASQDQMMVQIAGTAEKIANSSDFVEQRAFFNDLSKHMYQVVKGSSGISSPVYQQYCPMAFNNTGAYWLAAEKEINNPYFGDMMLKCGTVKEEL